LSHYLFYTKKCNELNAGGGGGAPKFFYMKVGASPHLENKGLAIGADLKISIFGI
jgi:hypothetical protein